MESRLRMKGFTTIALLFLSVSAFAVPKTYEVRTKLREHAPAVDIVKLDPPKVISSSFDPENMGGQIVFEITGFIAQGHYGYADELAFIPTYKHDALDPNTTIVELKLVEAWAADNKGILSIGDGASAGGTAGPFRAVLEISPPYWGDSIKQMTWKYVFDVKGKQENITLALDAANGWTVQSTCGAVLMPSTGGATPPKP